MNKDKKQKIMLIITVFSILIIVISATYAYFIARAQSDSSSSINVEAKSTDQLSFSKDDGINLYVTPDKFKKGDGDQTDSTTITATLIPNNNTNEATMYYNVYFIIDANDLTYTTVEQTPELLLKVTRPDNSVVESIVGLNKAKDNEGYFDITERHNVSFEVAKNYLIEADNEAGTTHEWIFEVTLVNLDSDQRENEGKTFTAQAVITGETKKDTYKLNQITAINTDNKTYNSITTKLDIDEGTSPIIDYYYAIEETEEEPIALNDEAIADELNKDYKKSDSDTYEFTKLKANQNYKIYAYGIDEDGISTNIKTQVIITDDYNYPRVDVSDDNITKTEYTIKVVATGIQGDYGISAYKFSNGDTWSEEQSSNEYTFTKLQPNTDYTISVIAVDTNGEVSNIWSKVITTEPLFLAKVCAGKNFAQCYKENYQLDSYLYHHDGTTKDYIYDSTMNYDDKLNGYSSLDELIVNKCDEEHSYTQFADRCYDINNKQVYKYYSLAYETSGELYNKEMAFNKAAQDGYIDTSKQIVDASDDSYRYTGPSCDISPENKQAIINDLFNTKKYTITYIAEEAEMTDHYTVYWYKDAPRSEDVSKYIEYYEKDYNGGELTETEKILFDEIKALVNSGEIKLFRTYGDPVIAQQEAIEDAIINGKADIKKYDIKYMNNYVYFGCNEEECTEDNLYRIIGVFIDNVKLIKVTSIGTNYWSGSLGYSTNNWKYSTFNTNVLNNSYLNSFDSSWQDKIADHEYYIGGIPELEKINNKSWTDYTLTDFRDLEIGELKLKVGEGSSTSSSRDFSCIEQHGYPKVCEKEDLYQKDKKIGLMYLTDYLYGISKENWNTVPYDWYKTPEVYYNNWMLREYGNWTISRVITDVNANQFAFSISSGGSFGRGVVDGSTNTYPVFYLNSDVTIKSGTGTENDPIILN